MANWPIQPADKTEYTDDDGFRYSYNSLENYWKRLAIQAAPAPAPTPAPAPAPATQPTTVITGGTSGAAYSIQQVSKLGVVASYSKPYQVDVAIPTTSDFMFPAVEVLKFKPGATDTQTPFTFDNGDATSFQADDKIVFDGLMHLKTLFSTNMTDDGALGTGKLFEAVLVKDLKSISKIEVS